MNEYNVLIFENTYKLTEYLTSLWLDYASSAIKESGRFAAALSGGKTPVEFYCKLSNIDQFELWRHTDIFVADERFVPADHIDSNSRMIKENLINYIFIEPHQFHPVLIEDSEPAAAAKLYHEHIRTYFKLSGAQLPRFDFMLLGIGEDGHTASLFSESDLSSGNGQFAIATDPIHLSYKRISLSMQVINNAKHIVCLVTGKNKSDILYKLVEKHEKFPAARINPANGQFLILADKAAGQRLLETSKFEILDQMISIKK